MKIYKFNKAKNVSGNVVKELRLKNNLTQQQLAEKLQLKGVDISLKEISKIENNSRSLKDFELFAIAEIFNVSTDFFRKRA